MRTTLKIHARSSDLARLQAQTVGEALRAAGVQDIEFNFRQSLGDLNLQDPLWKMPEKGVFTEDFLKDLETGACDMVVHSWKDLPTEARTKTEIAATLPRADVRDLFLFRRDRFESVRKSGVLRVLTSSPRRAYNLERFFKSYLPFQVGQVEFCNVRGNIPTRVRKLMSEDVDGLILAKAAIDRLLTAEPIEYGEMQTTLRRELAACKWMILPLSLNPTAAAQGALAIEIRKDRQDLRDILAKIDCRKTFAAVERERKILSSYGGGCHQKIGVNVLSKSYGEVLFLKGLTDAGERLDKLELRPVKTHGPKAKTKNEVWPLDPKEGFFERKPLDKSVWQSRLKAAKRIWIARENALPENAEIATDALVWSAGLKSWQKLASRGIWVNASSEGLGEAEDPRIESLVQTDGALAGGWLKLTHDSSAQGDAQALATYRLEPKATAPDLRGKTHFFWTSGSAFKRALELYPEIKGARHACGPGRTYERLMQMLGSDRNIDIFLDHEQWLMGVIA